LNEVLFTKKLNTSFIVTFLCRQFEQFAETRVKSDFASAQNSVFKNLSTVAVDKPK